MAAHIEVDAKQIEELVKESLSLNFARGQLTVEVDTTEIVRHIEGLLEDERNETESELER